MADKERERPGADIPTNFLLMKTRSRAPWALIVVIAVLAGIAGGVLWYFLAQ